MKIEIDTNKDSYEQWEKIQKLIESAYHNKPIRPVRKLVVKPGGKEDGAPLSRVW
jgi:hypothetical protein